MTKPVVLPWTYPLAALSVGGRQEFPPRVGRRHRCPGGSKNLLQIEGNKRKNCTSLLWRTQLNRKVWECLMLQSLWGESEKNKILLQVSEGLDLETFEKPGTNLMGAKTSTREGLAYKECSEVAFPATAAGLDVTGKAVSFVRPKSSLHFYHLYNIFQYMQHIPWSSSLLNLFVCSFQVFI